MTLKEITSPDMMGMHHNLRERGGHLWENTENSLDEHIVRVCVISPAARRGKQNSHSGAIALP